MAELYSLEGDLKSPRRVPGERGALRREIAAMHVAHGRIGERDGWLAAARQVSEREGAVRKMAETAWIDPEITPPKAKEPWVRSVADREVAG